MPPSKRKTEGKDAKKQADLPEGKAAKKPSKRHPRLFFGPSLYRLAEKHGSHRLSAKAKIMLDGFLVGTLEDLGTCIGGALKDMTDSTMLSKRDVEFGLNWMYEEPATRELGVAAFARGQKAVETFYKDKPKTVRKKKVAEAAVSAAAQA